MSFPALHLKSNGKELYMAVATRVKSSRKFWAKATPYLLILPVVVYYAFFWLRPVLSTFVGSFRDASGVFTFENYLMVFTDPDFIPALKNTTIIVIFSVTLEFIIALFLALLINRKFTGSAVFLFLAMIPMALPSVAVGAMWLTGFTSHGWINSLLYYLGVAQKIYWLAGTEWSLLALIIVIDAWTVIPSVMIILLAGLQNIPHEMEEAGYVFGGNYLTVLRKIQIPM